MTISVDGATSTALASTVRGAQWLIELDFTTGMQRFTTNPVSLTIGGNVYTGLGDVASVSDVSESEDASAQRFVIALSIARTPALLAATLGNIETYRNRFARLYIQVTDSTFQPVGAHFHRLTGKMEPVRVVRQRADPKGGPIRVRVELPCSRAGINRGRNATGLRLTHAQQQERFPGDMGLEYVQELVEKPALWLSKRFQELP